MAINGIGSFATQRLRDAYGVQAPATPSTGDSGFARRLAELVQDVDKLQDHAVEVQQSLIAGEAVEVHDVMVASEEAGLAFSLMLEVRNKLVDAYRELMRLQV